MEGVEREGSVARRVDGSIGGSVSNIKYEAEAGGSGDAGEATEEVALKLLRSIDTRLKGIEAAHLELAQAARNNNALMTNSVLNMAIANKTMLRIEAALKDKPVGLYTEERDRVKKDLGIVEEAEDEDGDDNEDVPREMPIVDLEAEEASGVESSEAETEESGKETGEETGGGAEESEGVEDEVERSGEVAGDMVE